MAIDAPIHTNEANLARVLGSGLPVLLVFWRRDCAPCGQLDPTLDRLARSYNGKALVVKVNAGEEPNLLNRYNISALPGLVFVKDGKALATATGAAGEMELGGWLNFLTAGGSRPPVPSGPSMPLRPTASASPPRPAGTNNGRAGQTAEAAGPTAQAAGQGQPVVLTDASFDKVIRNSRVPVMVDFWAEWCGPCRMVAPAVEALAREFAGRAVLGKLNVDENPQVSARYGVMSIPTLLIFRNGQMVDRVVGAQPAQVLRQKLAQQVN